MEQKTYLGPSARKIAHYLHECLETGNAKFLDTNHYKMCNDMVVTFYGTTKAIVESQVKSTISDLEKELKIK